MQAQRDLYLIRGHLDLRMTDLCASEWHLEMIRGHLYLRMSDLDASKRHLADGERQLADDEATCAGEASGVVWGEARCGIKGRRLRVGDEPRA